MKKNEQIIIAKIVAEALEQQKAQEHTSLDAVHARHIRRRVTIVVVIAVVIVATHHYTHIEPIGRIGEMTFGALFSWFFDKASRGE